MLDGDILHILAVLLDCTRATEWAEGASRMKVLKQEGVVTTLLYTYSELTWPVSDRDVITSAKLHVIKKGEEYKLVMKAQPKALPENEDVVRITRSDAHFHLKKQADGKVWIEYQVDVDPGGKLPKWLVTWASKKVPANTLRNVQKQVKKTQGDYDKVIPKIAALS